MEPSPVGLRRTMTGALIDELRDEIRSGRLAPGVRLRQLDVAARFGVSSTPVREAFAALEREGLLISSPHRGVVVFQPTVDDLHEIYDIRIPLEALATERAVEHIDAEDLDALAAVLKRMGALKTSPDAYTKLNRDFHERIYDAGRRPKLARLIAELRDASTAYLHLYATLAPTAEDTQLEHERIFAALAGRDVREAVLATTDHLRHTVERVSAGLREMGNGTDGSAGSLPDPAFPL